MPSHKRCRGHRSQIGVGEMEGGLMGIAVVAACTDPRDSPWGRVQPLQSWRGGWGWEGMTQTWTMLRGH